MVGLTATHAPCVGIQTDRLGGRAESLGNSDVSGSGKDATGSGVIRPTPIMANPITPAMMAEFMAKFGSMQAMAAKIEQLEAKVAVMKLVRSDNQRRNR